MFRLRTAGNGLDCAIRLISFGTMKGPRRIAARVWILGCMLLSLGAWLAAGADLQEARDSYLSGDYAQCIARVREALQKNKGDQDWQLLLTEGLLATGQYPQALTVVTNAVARDRWNIQLRWEARKVLLANGQPAAANDAVDGIVGMISRHPADYTDPRDLVVAGQVALLAGEDPKLVLNRLFAGAKREDPKVREVYLASGGVALDKHDYALAAKTFEEGLKELPADPDLEYGLAQAYAPSDPSLMSAALEAALDRNSNHVGCLLLLAEHSIDAEQYAEALDLLDHVKSVNPNAPEAWVYRAVVAHLQNQPKVEEQARQTALKFWATNPRVDFLIGQKLSQNYRFSEGAAHQRQALEFDPQYLPAKAQLAEDLLRLGQETQGWRLAQEVQKEDGYDVEAYNLTTLHDTMSKFSTLANENFLLRMEHHEAEVYGQSALNLLERARTNLCAKYDVELQKPTIVEVFPDQKDFAVRTFGSPGDPGYLGVCFGRVITANSPVSHPGAVNWESVLWHEFCHVVTLQKTHNKMPRWLSEGISVYEEGQANPSWGQHMNPRYREMILGDDLTPISKLSGAFLAPESDLALLFAYYESSLVVQFLIEHYGLEPLKAILNDLAHGTQINVAIAAHTEPIDKLDDDFAAYARQKAQGLAPGLDFERPALAGSALPGSGQAPSSVIQTNQASTRLKLPPPLPPKTDRQRKNQQIAQDSHALSETDLANWIAAHPTNFYALSEQARRLLEQKKFEEAKAPLEKLASLYPAETGPDSSWALLALAHQELDETNAEREVLGRLAVIDDQATPAYLRLMLLDAAAQDWPAVERNAQRYLAVNPLVAAPYGFLAQSSERLGDDQKAIGAYRVLLLLDPADPSEVHFQLGRLLYKAGQPEARRQVLEALEEAPRFKVALKLLLDMNTPKPQANAASPGITGEARQ